MQRYQLVMVGNPIDGKHLEVVMIVSAWSSVNDVVFGHEKIAAKGLRTRQFLIRPGHVMHNQAEAA